MSVQIENGNFARIHNAILENLSRCDLTGGEFRCVMHLLRSTYGWGKKADTISYSQWSDNTGLSRRTVIRALSKLVERNIISATQNGSNRPVTWQFNKYFDQWIDHQTSDRDDTKLVTGMTLDDDSSSDRDDTRLAQTSDRDDTATSDRDDTHKRYIKDNNTKDRGASAMEQAPNVECESLLLSNDERVTYRDVCDAYMSNGFGAVTAMTSEFIKSDIDEFTAEWCMDAMKIAARANKRTWNYVSGILKNWRANGRNDEQQPQPVGVVGGVVEGLVWD